MLSQHSRFARPCFAAPVAALLVSALCPACEVDSTVAEEEAQAELTSALHILWTGGPEQKRVTIEEAEDWADVLSTADPEAKDARSALGWLRTIVHTEKDDWIASRLLKNLLPLSCELLNPLYRDALTDPSPNVRWRAIQWFQSQKDSEALPLLENLWASEERPWVVPDLIEALAFNTSTRYRDDILGLARGEDVPLARAALRAFEILHDDALIPDLDEISRSGNRLVRQAALNALATWPESQDALEAVLRATRGTDRETLLSAIPLLKNFSSPDAVHHLMELSAHHADSQAREHALRALESTRPDGFVELLVGILREAPSEAVSSLQSEAISALHDLDDPDVLPMLSGVDPRVGGAGLYSFTELIDNLSRDRNASPRGVQSISVSCGRSSFRNSDGDEQSVPLVEPPEGLQTIRCWEFPFVPGDPEDFPRIPAGTEVWIQDHFERGGESWVQVPGDFEECWVRRNELEPAVSQASKGSRTPVDRFRVEIDISFEEFESAPTRALRDAGLLKVIEPGDLVVGVVLSLHPDEPKTIPQLLDSYRDDNSLLDDAVLELLNALSKALPDRPDLIDFFRKHPGAKNAIEGPSSDESGGEKEEFQLIDP